VFGIREETILLKDPVITDILDRLPTMKRPELVKLWQKGFGRLPHNRLRPELMRPVLAFRLQERLYGGDQPDKARRLREIAKSLVPENRSQHEAHNRFKAGTRIIREWKGKTYEIQISEVGYEFEGRTYRSLSPIANLITGTRWSGPAFFGTKRKMGSK